ncbi:MAG TPA: RES family NAD+ phosphorylase [Allosphingosinicella sp.]|nr:RES family NAD+ phosphorylase [Allosphingosinicella sp.]HKT15622.1 RES family NAD+ phosphorylase [Allosphingosinicella sp.]
MIHDPVLIDRLGQLPTEVFSGEVFRATRQSLDPSAFSTRGGRWAQSGGVSVLYTSLVREGALAEISYHWRQLTPLPTKPVMLHRLNVSTRKTMRLVRATLSSLEVDVSRFSELGYARTQEIGAAVAFLECDGLIVPSARWDCDNLVLYGDRLPLDCDLEVVESESVDWLSWSEANLPN